MSIGVTSASFCASFLAPLHRVHGMSEQNALVYAHSPVAAGMHTALDGSGAASN